MFKYISSSLYRYIYFKVFSQGRSIKFITNNFRTWTQSSVFSRHSMETLLRFATLRPSFIHVIYIPMRIENITWNWVTCFLLGLRISLKSTKKPGLRPASNIIKPTQTRNNCEKYTFCVKKSGAPKKSKTGRVPSLCLVLTNDHACHEKLNPFREITKNTVFTKKQYFVHLKRKD